MSHRDEWTSRYQHIIDMNRAEVANRARERASRRKKASSSPGPSQPALAKSNLPGRPAVEHGPGERSSTPTSELDILSDDSQDSFDWIGDDFQTREDPEDELFFEEPLPTAPDHFTFTKLMGVVPVNAVNNILLIFFIFCILVFTSKFFFHVPMAELAGIELHMWVLMAFLGVFCPVWACTGILKFARFLRSLRILSKSEIPALIEAVRVPMSFSISALFVGLVWLSKYPISCPAQPTNEEMALSPICYYIFVPRLFFFVFIAGITLSAVSLAMTSMKSNFQERNFKTRLIESRFKVYVIDQLLQAAKQERSAREAASPRSQSSTASAHIVMREFMFNLPFILPEQLLYYWKRISKRSAFYMRASRASNAIDGSDLEDHTDDFSEFRKTILRTIHTAGYETVATAPPRTDYHAKRMAKMIFHYLCPKDRKHLTMEDFASVIPFEAACTDAYYTFDQDRDGTITKAEFRGTVVRIFREQRNLSQSVKNSGSVLSILDTISMACAIIGLFLLLLALFNVNVQSIFAVSASIILGLNFVVFEGANKTFQALLFLFVMHPFDVGDRIVVGGDTGYKEEDILTVLHLNVQNTIFRRWNGLVVIIPNHVLSGGTLTNLSRNSEQWERVEFDIYSPDPLRLTVKEETEKLTDLRQKIDEFVREYPNDYYKAFDLRAMIAADSGKGDKNMDVLHLVLKIRCKETVDYQKKWTRHARILAYVKQATKASGIEFAGS